jgi:hypothetical protein
MVDGRQPSSELAWTVLEQATVRVDAIGAGGQGPAAQLGVVVLAAMPS